MYQTNFFLLLVISACGIGDSGTEDVVEKWDLVTWETTVLPWTCPPGGVI